MPIRIAAIGVGHWHSLHDAAYLKALSGMPEAELAGVHDPDAAMVEQRAAQLGGPPAFTDYREMLARIRPDFVVAHARRMLAEGAFGPVSHFYFRSNRPTSARYVAWGAPWMLDPALAGGGCLRNVGLHGLDALLFMMGEEAEVTGAQISSRALGAKVEDYATVLLRTTSGVLATIEVGNTYPGARGDAEWRLAGRDALLAQRGGTMRCTTAAGEQELPGAPSEPLPTLALRDALQRWQRGEPPAAGIEDCCRAMRLVDQAYEIAGR